MHGLTKGAHRCFQGRLPSSTLYTTRLLHTGPNAHAMPISSMPLLSRRGQKQQKQFSRVHTILDAATRQLLAQRSFTSSSTVTEQGGSKLVDYLLADVGEGITECEIVKWFVEPGSMVEEFDVLVEVQSDKASVEITSRYAGKVAEHCYKVGEVAKVGSALCKIEVQGGEESEEIKTEEEVITKESQGQESQHSSATTEKTMASSNGKVGINVDGGNGSLATPAVRRIIREHGVKIDEVTGTGKAGRVTKEDVQKYLSLQSTIPEQSSTNEVEGKGNTVVEREEDKIIALSGTRKAMFKAMTTTWNVPHFMYSDEIDVTKLDQIRKEMQKSSGRKGEDGMKMTLLPFLIKALSLAMYNHPIFRSILDSQAMSLRERQQHRISIALSSPRGLLTPTLESDIRNANIVEIGEQIQSLQRISNERGLSQKEMGNGATVTLSNIGSVGGMYTFPLIPPTGQLVIGAVGKSRILPRFDEMGDIVKALTLPASFSADHRVVEGVELAKFVQEWKQLVENPASWLLKLR